jgi:chromosome partitioning protein
MIDADPHRNVMDWSKLPGAPANLTVIGDATEENIVDRIEMARAQSVFVLVDLEGAASLMVSYAISLADLVVVPMQGSQLDAKQAARQMKLVRAQERVVGRPIPFTMLLTRTNPAITPRTQRHIEERFAEPATPGAPPPAR